MGLLAAGLVPAVVLCSPQPPLQCSSAVGGGRHTQIWLFPWCFGQNQLASPPGCGFISQVEHCNISTPCRGVARLNELIYEEL